MHTEKERSFLIHILYGGTWLFLFWLFFQYIFPMCFPFLLGFAIAFFMRPLIRRIHRRCGIQEKLLAFFCMLGFDILLLTLLGYLLLQSYLWLKDGINVFLHWYEEGLRPYLDAQATAVAVIEIDPLYVLEMIKNTLLSTVSSFIAEMASSLLQLLQQAMAHLPNVILGFFMTLFSSFLFQMDYPRITAFLIRQLPKKQAVLLFAAAAYLKQTMRHMVKAYGILMLITMGQLWLGFWLLDIPNAFMIAGGIALFDAMPVLGCGGIMLPWIILCFLQQQTQTGIGLLIVYLIVISIRSVLEPKIMGKQLGIHPLIMLISMYIGGKLFGILGFLLLPNMLMLLRCLHDGGYIRLYR